VVKQQIDEVLLIPKDEPVLPADEAEAIAQFEDEALEFVDKPVLQLPLTNRLADSEKFEVVAALDRLVGLLGEVIGQRQREIVGFLLGPRPLISLGLNLVEEDVPGPAEGPVAAT